MEENKEYMEETIKENLPQKPKKNNNFKIMSCKVLNFNKHTHDLDVDFDGYGIRIHNVKECFDDSIELKYKGSIGKPNFVYKLQVLLCVKMHMKNYLNTRKK